MIDFEEELNKFQPSKEVDEAEDYLISRNITDMTDILEELLKENKEQV